jgi:hypothetical protein
LPREPKKTDRIRGWSLTAKPTKTPVNTGRLNTAPYPHRGDRGGDTQKLVQFPLPPAAKNESLSLEKSSCEVKERHHSTTLREFDECRPRFHAGTTGFFAVEDNTSCDFKTNGSQNIFLLHYKARTLYFSLMPPTLKKKKNLAAVALGKLGGLKGGDARAKKLSAKRRSEIARKAVLARWEKYYAEK